MNTSVVVYTRLPEICAIERLAEYLQDAGWEARILDEYSRTAHLFSLGALPKESIIYSWPLGSRKGKRLSRYFPPDQEIDAWMLPEEDLAGCNISVSQLETPDDQFELDLWSDNRKLAPEKLAVLQQAQCCYEISNWVTDGSHSERLLRDTAWALAKETGGIVFDPQTMRALWAEELFVQKMAVQ